VNEQQAALFARLGSLSALGLRYFNVYGPRQDPSSQYAGVISRFADRVETGRTLTVYGDGLQTRDFIYVGDVARANVAALASAETGVCNIGTGRSVTLLELIETLGSCVGRKPDVEFTPPVAGDIRHSAMRPARMNAWLGLETTVPLANGLSSLLAAAR
jgi:UDP-glucose 4-epimerase